MKFNMELSSLIWSIIILAIINLLIIGYLIFEKFKHKFDIEKVYTEYNNVLIGYEIFYQKQNNSYWECLFYIPIRNKEKAEYKAIIAYLNKKKLTDDHKQILRAWFSWLKTEKEISEFERKYRCIDSVLINKLINEKSNV